MCAPDGGPNSAWEKEYVFTGGGRRGPFGPWSDVLEVAIDACRKELVFEPRDFVEGVCVPVGQLKLPNSALDALFNSCPVVEVVIDP